MHSCSDNIFQPHSILVVGCGLIGTSFALAVRARHPQVELVGVELYAQYRTYLEERRIFSRVLSDIPTAGAFSLCVLATPSDIACVLLERVTAMADIVMDVCSTKMDICRSADNLGLRTRFAPTHPMAGSAASGPASATGDLFEGRTWITLPDWPATGTLYPFLESLGAVLHTVPSASEHDLAMAFVSHGIHLTSLSAMLAFQQVNEQRDGTWSNLTGPAFADITRLSASQVSFWRNTLVENRDNILLYIGTLKRVLEDFETKLEFNDTPGLEDLLTTARMAHCRWKEERS